MQAAPRSLRWELLIEAGPPSFPSLSGSFSHSQGAMPPGLRLCTVVLQEGRGGVPRWGPPPPPPPPPGLESDLEVYFPALLSV